MRKNFVAVGAGFTIGIVAIAGFRFPDTSVREARPKLTILKSAEPYGGCSFGTNYTLVRNTASVELKIPASEAIKSAAPELLAQGYIRVQAQGTNVGYRREFESGRVFVLFREGSVNEPARVIVSVRLDKVMWYGMRVPSPLGL